MSLTLPNLDDRSFDELVEEAKSLIPVFAPDWTNHNASDPGITLIELLAWLTEMLIYRTNRVPDPHVIAFLRLLKGDSTWEPGDSLDAEIRETLRDLGKVYRAVTCADYEALAISLGMPDVARAKCVPRRNLEDDSGVEVPGAVSVVVLPQIDAGSDAPANGSNQHPFDIQNLRELLQQRSLIATKVHVVEAAFTSIAADISLRPQDGAAVDSPPQTVVGQVTGWLDPRTGGADGAGWPFGRNVYASDFHHFLEEIPAVDFVVDIALFSLDDTTRSLGRAIWHSDGAFIGLRLPENGLPVARIESIRVFAARDITPVNVEVHVKPASSIAPETFGQLQGAVQVAVKQAFLPKPNTDEQLAGLTVTKARIEESINAIAGGDVESIGVISVTGADELPQETVTLSEDQLADVQVTVELTLSEEP